MNDAFYIAATGLRAQQSALDTVSNNLANLNTTAFKRSSVAFGELIAPSATQRAGDASSPEAQLAATAALGTAGLGVSMLATPKVMTAGEYTQTKSQLDVAVQGSGLIELAPSTGETLLWRGGTLAVSKEGLLTGPSGLPIKGVSPLPARTQGIQIDGQGRVFASIAGQTTPRQIGQMGLVTVMSPASLEARSDGVYKVRESVADVQRGRPGDAGFGSLAQGTLEASNVNIADEMVSLMWIQRSYGANARVVQAADELMSMTNSLKR